MQEESVKVTAWAYGERTNQQVVRKICEIMDEISPKEASCNIDYSVKDRPGHVVDTL